MVFLKIFFYAVGWYMLKFFSVEILIITIKHMSVLTVGGYHGVHLPTMLMYFFV